MGQTVEEGDLMLWARPPATHQCRVALKTLHFSLPKPYHFVFYHPIILVANPYMPSRYLFFLKRNLQEKKKSKCVTPISVLSVQCCMCLLLLAQVYSESSGPNLIVFFLSSPN